MLNINISVKHLSTYFLLIIENIFRNTTNFLHLLAMCFHRLVRNDRKLQEILRSLQDTMIILIIRIENLMLNGAHLLHLGEVGGETDILHMMWTIAHIVKDAMCLMGLKEIFV